MALVPEEPGSPTGLPAWPWPHSRAVARLGGGPRGQAAGSCQGPRRCPPRPLAQVWRASRPPEVVLPAGDPRPQTELEVTLLPGGGWRWGFCHGLSWPFVLPAQSANDGEASASLERDSGLRAGGERGLSVTVDLAALTSLRFLLNSWIGKQLA